MLKLDPNGSLSAGSPDQIEMTDATVTSENGAKQNSKSSTANISDFLQDMPDVVCLSHLRWDFVYQRPQHLLSRFANHGRLFFFEEPQFYDGAQPRLDVSTRDENVHIIVAHLPHGLTPQESDNLQITLLEQLFAEYSINRYIAWYYTPMALEVYGHLQPILTVYDCMDELAAFKGASPRLRELEAELFKKADLVFTGGHSIYESKRTQHPEVYAFPSSIDKAHFAQARTNIAEPADQQNIPHPRFGFYGVVDERFDIELLGQVAALRPEWHWVIIGPVVKIDSAVLPQAENIHYLGGKNYKELPVYLSSWDVATMPFAINESTKYISPTKTPEYLAGGKPVVSTPIRDVIRPYGDQNLVHIASTAEEFEVALEKALAQRDDQEWLAKTDAFLANISWDHTWQNMVNLMQIALTEKLK
jgi:UDP-galactopyranose mutase